ncbi:hypothetical protein [Gemmatimonas sp.]|uniref:hypothetical protein n=1 Tax=Gemmatimonas sp. TaxID=1962908 RepID=UPI0025C5BCA9|nr:hypothetical protein [Gemmatimonas sp.]MCA2991185.1 hypothetical protein [Gemmatimonas sp.]
MSGLQKRLRRKLLLDAARQQRAATAGGGQYRKPLNAWVRSTKRDLVDAVREADQRQREAENGT